jgi:hypothetical protein
MSRQIMGLLPGIGLNTEFLSELKQHILIFDKLGVIDFEGLVGMMLNGGARTNEERKVTFELFRLLENKLVISCDIRNYLLKIEGEVKIKFLTDIQENAESMRKTIEGLPVDKQFEFDMNLWRPREMCLAINHAERGELEAVSIVPSLHAPPGALTRKGEIIQIVLENLPIPDNSTSWEQISEFKSDEENRGKLSSLRNWMNKAVRENISKGEAEDEFNELLYLYTQSLKAHKLNTKRGVIKSLVVGGAEIIENAARLKFSEIAKGFFSVQQQEVDLMKAELEAPGRELAYIYKAKEKFDN